MGEVVVGDLLGAEGLDPGLLKALGPLLGGQVNQVNWGLATLGLGEHKQGLAVWAKFLLPTLSFGADLAKFRHASSLSNHLYITIG